MKLQQYTVGANGQLIAPEGFLNTKELNREFKSQVESGRTFIVNLVERKSDNAIWNGEPVVDMFVAQCRNMNNGTDLDADQNRIGYGSWWAAEAGWDRPILRTIKTVPLSFLQRHNFDVGSLLPEWTNIHQKDTLEPANIQEALNPRLRENERGVAYVMVNAKDKPIYRRTGLTLSPEDTTPLDICYDFRVSKTLTLEAHRASMQAKYDALLTAQLEREAGVAANQ